MREDKFEYFMKRTEKDFNNVNGKLDHLSTKVDGLRLFEAKVLGIVAVLTIILAPTVTLLTLYFRTH